MGRYNAAVAAKTANILRLRPHFPRPVPMLSGLIARHDHAQGMIRQTGENFDGDIRQAAN